MHKETPRNLFQEQSPQLNDPRQIEMNLDHDNKIFEEIKRGYLQNIVELETLTPEIAHLLSKSKGLSTAEYVSADETGIIEELDEHILPLDGIRILEDSAAEQLSHFKGALSFLNLEYISDKSAESLIKHDGVLFIPEGITITPRGVESLSKRNKAVMGSGEPGKTIRRKWKLRRMQGAV